MDKTTTPAASAAKTAQDTIREALDQGSLCSNVAYNLGQHREDSEQILGTVRKFDELRLAALASLKSLDGQEVVALTDETIDRIGIDIATELQSANWPRGSVVAEVENFKRYAQRLRPYCCPQPSDPRLSVDRDRVKEAAREWILAHDGPESEDDAEHILEDLVERLTKATKP